MRHRFGPRSEKLDDDQFELVMEDLSIAIAKVEAKLDAVSTPATRAAITLEARSTSRRTTMPLFWKPYTSDVTDFISELKAKKPTLEAEQRAGRALLWDKQIDRSAQADYQQSRVPQSPYVYFSRPRKG